MSSMVSEVCGLDRLEDILSRLKFVLGKIHYFSGKIKLVSRKKCGAGPLQGPAPLESVIVGAGYPIPPACYGIMVILCKALSVVH